MTEDNLSPWQQYKKNLGETRPWDMLDPTVKKVSEEVFKITGDWKIQAKNLKEKFSQLTDEDLNFVIGKENDLLARVEKKLNKNREEVINIIKKSQPVKA
jgi:uncharacterized protein YjbJ (UPF0337 family)